MNRRGFLLRALAGVLVASIPPRLSRTDEIEIAWRHKVGNPRGTEVQKRSEHGEWMRFRTLNDATVDRIVDNVNPARRYQYRIRALGVGRNSEWTYTGWT